MTYGSNPFPCGMAEALKASSEPLRKNAAKCSGRLLAGCRPRSRATAPVPQLRDGDSISFSMTLGLLPILARIVAYLLLKTVRLLIVVASVPLAGGYGHPRVLPLISVVSTPGVGGFGHQNLFQEVHVGKTRAPSGQRRSSHIETSCNAAQGSWSVASAQVQEQCAQLSCTLR